MSEEQKNGSLWNQLIGLCKKYEEMIRYIIVGGLTTALNYAVYAVCLLALEGKDYDYIVGTAAAFVVAVAFAYVANKYAVFHTKTADRRDAMREAGSFFLMRAISFAVELGLMALCVDALHFGKWISKIPVNVLIVLLNYVFSKLYIFRKPEEQGGRHD